jgi:hypothetical protein
MRIKIFDTVLGSTVLDGEPELSIEEASPPQIYEDQMIMN